MEALVNKREAVAPWCSVDLSSGNLTIVLEPYNCFDAEVYADELKLDEPIDFREDQRSMWLVFPSFVESRSSAIILTVGVVSLGRWILRYLFANLIDEEIRRDESYRQKLNENVLERQTAARANAPTSIDLPRSNLTNWDREKVDQASTPRASGSQLQLGTPGLGIGLATPAPGAAALPGVPEKTVSSPLSPPAKDAPGDKDDYFAGGNANAPTASAATDSTETKTSMDNGSEKTKDKERPSDTSKSPGSAFGKKFRISFSSKKLGRSPSQVTQEKPVIVDEKAEESESSSTNEREVDDSFFGIIQKIRNNYEKQFAEAPDKLIETRVTPSLPNETPVLKLPPGTKVIIQEETSGGSATVYQGTVENVGKDADIIEQKAPMWLGEVLLQNIVPAKEPVKISFVLHPTGNLPVLSPADGNNRLNANRMLRVKKILAYVAERIEEPERQGLDGQGLEDTEVDELAPAEYLELYCNDQVRSCISNRSSLWRFSRGLGALRANCKELTFHPAA